jgi:ketosteroid isomerase-like protein
MSQEKVERLRKAYDQLARSNYVPFRELLDREIMYWLRPEELEPGPHLGRDAAMDLLGQPVEDDEFVGQQTEAREIVDAGECLVAWVRGTGRGRASGAPFETEGWIVHRFERGRIIEMREYDHRAEALEAVGLREETRSQENVDADRTPWDGELRADDVMRRRLE